MAGKKGRSGRKGFTYEWKENKLRETSLDKAQQMLELGKTESGQLLSQAQIEILKVILSRAVRQKIEHSGENGAPISIQLSQTIADKNNLNATDSGAGQDSKLP